MIRFSSPALVLVLTVACFFSDSSCAAQSFFSLPPEPLSWDELAAHAGLAGLQPKTKEQFKIDVLFERGRNVDVIKAAISLSGKEWEWISSSSAQHLLHPWGTDEISNDLWKSTVDLILPFKCQVDVERLNMKDPSVILRRRDHREVRLYMLSPDPGGKAGVLYYFYASDWEP